MTRTRAWIALMALIAALSAAPLGATGQLIQVTFDTYGNPALRILQDYNLKGGDTASQVVVIAGDATIDGHVSQDVVVVLGKARLGPTAVIDGNFIVVAGTADVAAGAKVGRDMVVVGEVQTPAEFSPGGEHVFIGTAGLGEGLRALVPWLTHGLLLGRPIVPSLGWVWIVVAIFFFINLCLNALFDTPVRACTQTMRATPLSAFVAGLLVLLLAGPVCVLLAVSVIGIAVIPFFLCAIVVAAVLGRVAFARWIGMSVVYQDDPADRAASLRSFVIGAAVMTVAYMIPIVGFMVWILAGVFGLGAATLAAHSAYRRENPKPPKKMKPEPPSPAPVSPLDTSGRSSLQAGGPDATDPDRVEPAAAVALDLPPAPDFVSSTELPSGGSYAGSDLVFYPKASFNERLVGLALDAVVIAIAVQLFGLDDHGEPGERLIVLLALAYHVSFWTLRGTTLGGIICQLRVVRTDGKKLEFSDALIRGLTGIFSLLVVGLGFFWILRDPERQGWHDRVAGTYVVKVPRAFPA